MAPAMSPSLTPSPEREAARRAAVGSAVASPAAAAPGASPSKRWPPKVPGRSPRRRSPSSPVPKCELLTHHDSMAQGEGKLAHRQATCAEDIQTAKSRREEALRFRVEGLLDRAEQAVSQVWALPRHDHDESRRWRQFKEADVEGEMRKRMEAMQDRMVHWAARISRAIMTIHESALLRSCMSAWVRARDQHPWRELCADTVWCSEADLRSAESWMAPGRQQDDAELRQALQYQEEAAQAERERCARWAEVAEETQLRASHLVEEAQQMSARTQRRAGEAERRSQELQRQLEIAQAELEQDHGDSVKLRTRLSSEREVWIGRLAVATEVSCLQLALTSWKQALGQVRRQCEEPSSERDCERCAGWAEVAEDTQRRAAQVVEEAHRLSAKSQHRAAEAERRAQELQRRLQEALLSLEEDRNTSRQLRERLLAQRAGWSRRLATAATRPCLQFAFLAWRQATSQHAATPRPPRVGHRTTAADVEAGVSADAGQERQLAAVAAVGDRLWKHAVLAAWRHAATATASGGASAIGAGQSGPAWAVVVGWSRGAHLLLLFALWRLAACGAASIEVRAHSLSQAHWQAAQLLHSAFTGWRHCARFSGLLRWRSWAQATALIRIAVCAWHLAVFKLRATPSAGSVTPRRGCVTPRRDCVTPPCAQTPAAATARKRGQLHTDFCHGRSGVEELPRSSSAVRSAVRKAATPSRVKGYLTVQGDEVPRRSSSAARLVQHRQGLSESGSSHLDRGEFSARNFPKQQLQPPIHVTVSLFDLQRGASMATRVATADGWSTGDIEEIMSRA